ncbi:MAG: hypothetical protein AAB393_00875, partial [Bacteroidota bacterium]
MKSRAITGVIRLIIVPGILALVVLSRAVVTTSSTPLSTTEHGYSAVPTPGNSELFLPIVMKQPTPTPTQTPAPTPTPVPHLQDGVYIAPLNYDGEMRFTVTEGGTRASSAS